MVNILAIDSELDSIGMDMLARVSANPEINVYIATPSAERLAGSYGRCRTLPMPPCRSKLSPAAIRAIRRIIRRHAIDALFSPGSKGLSNGLMASLGTRARNIGYRGTQAKVRATDPTYYLGILNPRVAHIVCETDDIRDYLARRIPARKLSVNLKPFDVSWVEEAMRSPKQVPGVPPGAVKCVYVGQCKGRPFKGLSVLIRAMHAARDTRLHLLFIGSYDAADRELAESGPAAGRIRFLGFQENPVQYLPAQDIFVLPSLRDASPRVVREAMACGLPCVVSDIPGARSLPVDGVTGVLVRPDDPQLLADALCDLAADEAKRRAMGRAGRERIIRDFSVDDYARKFGELFLSFGRGRLGGQG